MIKNDNFSKILINHCNTYPEMQLRDAFKLIYQSAFGAEHMVKSEKEAEERINAELASAKSDNAPQVESIGNGYSRIHLSYLSGGLTPKTLATIFRLSSTGNRGGENALSEMLADTEALINEGALPWSISDFSVAAEKWREAGFTALHHSDAFRAAYKPSYRVISDEYTRLLPLLSRIDGMLSEGNFRLAIEGGSASGKTTLASMLQDIYGCTVFHMDDFFLPPEKKTEERLKTPGGNVDHERFLSEVLIPLSQSKAVEYRRYDCGEGKLMPPVHIEPHALTVIEGAYSMHPDLRKYYSLSVFLDIDGIAQRKRIEKRNSPDMAKRFFSEWIPLEELYFSAFSAKDNCDMILR